MKWNDIEVVPDNTRVLLLWKDGHIESGVACVHDDIPYHFLDNGEMLNSNPTYWAYISDLPDDCNDVDIENGEWE